MTGDVMRDAVCFNRELAWLRSTVIGRLGLADSNYAAATRHRAENTQMPRQHSALDALAAIA
jgi:UDP-N-acetylglucosamine 2-epimerase